jgi:iron complex outermembrane receptor protein
MPRNHSVRVAIAAALSSCLSSLTLAQETRVEEVVVTSTALHENPLEIAQPTMVVGGDELRRQIAASLGETLAAELGVSSTYFGPNASQPVIRGLSGYRVQVLQDGAAALDVSSLSQDHAVSIESVVSQQIEVIKGPATLLYGSGAAGGLVNVVTSRIPTAPLAPFAAALELRGDTAIEERTGAASIDSGFGVLAFHADYFDRTTDDVEIPGFIQSAHLRRDLAQKGEAASDAQGRLENSASDSRGGAVGASIVGDAGFAGVAWNRYESVYGIPAEDSAFIDLQQDRIDARGEWRMASTWLDTLHVAGAHSDYAHTEFEAPGEPGTIFEQDAYELRVAADHHWGKDWRGTFGAQYVDTDFEAIGDEAFVPPSLTRASSAFVFEEKHFARWTLELGARAERQTIAPASEQADYDETAINASTGFVFKLQTDRALAINVTRTERHPQAAELYGDGPHLAAARIEVGDATLDKETALTADVSLRQTGNGMQWTLTAFYNDYTDYIYLSSSGEIDPAEELPVYEFQQGGAKLYGFEAEILLPLLATPSHDLQLRLASDFVRGKLDTGENLPQIPPLRFGLGLHYEKGAWHAGIEAFRNTQQDDVIADELPSAAYTLVTADASYRLPLGKKSALLFLRATNLLDEDARLATSPLKDIAPLPGRSVHFGIRAEL